MGKKKPRHPFCDWLELERKRQNLSHRALAKKMEMSHNTVTEVEAGKSGVSRAFALRAALALHQDEDTTLARAGYIPDDLTMLLQNNPHMIRAILQVANLRPLETSGSDRA